MPRVQSQHLAALLLEAQEWSVSDGSRAGPGDPGNEPSKRKRLDDDCRSGRTSPVASYHRSAPRRSFRSPRISQIQRIPTSKSELNFRQADRLSA